MIVALESCLTSPRLGRRCKVGTAALFNPTHNTTHHHIPNLYHFLLVSAARRADLLAECEANSKLQSRFDLLSSQLHHHNGRSAAAAASTIGPVSAGSAEEEDSLVAPMEQQQFEQSQGSGEWGGMSGSDASPYPEAEADISPKSALQGMSKDLRKK